MDGAYGGFMGMSDEELKRILAMMGPSDADKKQAKSLGLLSAGLAMLGAPKGQEWNALGRAGLLGVGAYQNELQDLSRQKFQGIGARSALMNMASQEQGLRDAAEARQLYGQLPRAGPTASLAPTNANATKMAQGPDYYTLYMQRAEQIDALNKSGNPLLAKQADAYRERALKFRDENLGLETVMVNGQPTIVQRRKYGAPEAISGMEPKPDYKEVDTGDKKTFVDPLTGRQGPSLGVNVSPNTKFTGDITMRGQNMVDARSRESNAIAQNKPQWDSASGQFVYPPTRGAPSGVAVQPAGYNKADKPLTESQAKATAFVNQMQNANRELADLARDGFDGKTYGQQAAVVAAGSEGIPYVPGSASVARAVAGGNAQRYENAELQWTEPVLRFMTGANAPKEEIRRNAATFFPRPGDTEDVVAQKSAARASMERAIRMATGPGEKQLEMPKAAEKPAAPKVGEVRDGYRFKGGDPSRKENWQEVK